MRHAVVRLPDRQLAALSEGYRRAARSRRVKFLAAAVLLILIGLSAIEAEVDPKTFESNTRSATIIGVVGAGGIGLHLSEQIRVLEWRQVSFLILLILIAVAAIDFVSGRLRAAMAGRKSPPA
jgi:ABC-type phosphate/phosphonate transport system permease subunit